MSARTGPGAGLGLPGLVWGRVRRMLRLRRTIVAGSVRYTEVTGEPLHRAVSRHGGGFKDYVAEFTGGGRMRIRCTASRIYADLASDPRADLHERVARAVRPGMRVLVLGSGTGQIGEYLCRLAGPSGGVVCVEGDEESARFAARRYALPNAAFEHGGVRALAGELDGAFDVSVVLEAAPLEPEEARALVSEVVRVTASGGPIVMAARIGAGASLEQASGLQAAMEEFARSPGDHGGRTVRLQAAEGIGGWAVREAASAGEETHG